jgi:hypothetical protein
MENLTDEWLAADAALALVAARNGAGSAETSICNRAYAGRIKARASSLIRPKSQNLGPPKDATEHNCAVPKEFWGPSQGWHPTWATGDFATWLDKLGHWKAFGVVFDRAGIEGMLQPLTGAGEASHFLPDGRPSDSADVFSRTAFVVKDPYAYARGEGRPYRNDAERIANMEASRLAHLVALAKCLREGGRCQDFKSETVPWHGGSPAKLPLELALAFTDDSSLLTAEQCWAMVMTWRNTPNEPWPGTRAFVSEHIGSADDPYTQDEIKNWINDNPEWTNQKSARTEFMKQERARGLSATFEAVWQDLKQRSKGRPPTKK